MFTAASVLVWTDSDAPDSVIPQRVYVGPDPIGLGGFQVALAECSGPPSREALVKLFRARQGKTNIQMVVVAVFHGRAWILGPDDRTAVIEGMPVDQAARLLQSALDEPDALAAYARLGQLRRSLDTTGLSGFTNNGLFASHHIRHNVPLRPDWTDATARSIPLLNARGERLIAGLGFVTQRHAGSALLLTGGTAAPHAVAVLLDESEQFDSRSPRFQLSPVAWGLNIAAREGVPWLLVLRKDQIRLYPAKDGVGVGQKGQSETYFEIDLAALEVDKAAFLSLIFSADALKPGGTTQEILDGSSRYATELGARLRERVFIDVVPRLSTAVARELQAAGHAMDSDGLDLSYRLTLRLLFRLLFQAYAEDRGLLPSGRNERYDANSLKTIARRDIDTSDDDYSPTATSLWLDLAQVWNAIDEGNRQWEVPAYNGGLFGADPVLHPEGALLSSLNLPDSVLGPALQALLVDDTDDGVRGPVDFRSLSVREFGTIYEGLLESSLSLAPTALVVDSRGAWVPAGKRDQAEVRAGEVYFHSASGERKATGSYFTPSFVVDHLIQTSLEPALSAHLDRIRTHLARGDEAAAGRDFFDFRVADLAMGSGHFLIAAIDRTEAMMRDLLSDPDTQVPAVNAELLRLATVAREALGKDESAIGEIEPVALLRRQIARRCIYGLDINPLAVELARLAIWIHTFVPGLPMSSLDHGLVCANSLTGVGTIDEAMNALIPERAFGQVVAFEDVIANQLAGAKALLAEVAASSEASKKEVKAAAVMAKRAREAAAPARHILNAAIAARIGAIDPRLIDDTTSLMAIAESDAVRHAVESINPAHFPYLFPEVFLRTDPGFDVLIGNPPWEELMVEEPKFWLRVEPGLFGLRPAEMKKKIAQLRLDYPDLVEELQRESEAVAAIRALLLTGPYPGLGTGDIDLYQAFAWRNWQLLRTEGRAGLVFPRSLLNSAGGAEWRAAVLGHSGAQVVTLLNTNGWVFPSVHGQYSIALITADKTVLPEGRISMCGPFANLAEFTSGRQHSGELAYSTLLAASTGAAVPQLPDAESVAVFTRLREHPRLDERHPSWDFRPVAEFHATNDRSTFDAGGHRAGRWPVYGGSSFNLWTPDTGEYYAWATPTAVKTALFEKRKKQAKTRSSAFYGLSAKVIADRSTLPCLSPRVTFRDVTNATNTRTVIASLVPPEVVLVNSAPYLLTIEGGAKAEAYVLAVLSSRCLDWYARRYVELHVNYHILNGLPIPRFVPEDPLIARTIHLAGSLAAVDARYATWAKACGVKVGTLTSASGRRDAIEELDALMAVLYGLTKDQLTHLYATFHRGWDYGPELDRVLAHFATHGGSK